MRRLIILIALFSLLSSPAGTQQGFTLPVKPNSVRFAVIGDMGTGSREQYEVAQRMLEARQKFPFEFVIMVGDNIYGANSPKDMEKKFEIPYKTLLDGGVKFYAALGNHDDVNERFYKNFNMNGKQFYTFRFASVRFFALDSNYMSPEQLDWLSKELQASGSDWKIPFFHHPLYSSAGRHGSTPELRQLLEPLFINHKVHVVFQGHDHAYERTKPQGGIVYFVEGSSGKLRSGDLEQTSFKATGFDTDCTFMLVEIAGDELYFQTISRTGKTVDSGVILRADPAKAEAKPASSTTAASSESGAAKPQAGAEVAPAKPASSTEPGAAAQPEKAPAPPAATTAPAKPGATAKSKANPKAPAVVATTNVGTAKTSPPKAKAPSGKVVAKAPAAQPKANVTTAQTTAKKSTSGKVVTKAPATQSKTTATTTQTKATKSTKAKVVTKAKTPEKKATVAPVN